MNAIKELLHLLDEPTSWPGGYYVEMGLEVCCDCNVEMNIDGNYSHLENCSYHKDIERAKRIKELKILLSSLFVE